MDEILSSIRRIIDKNDEAPRREPPVMPVFDPPPPAVNDTGHSERATPDRPPLSRDDLDSFADAIDARAAAPAEARPVPQRAAQARNGKYQARFSEDDSRAFARVASALAATTGTPQRQRPAATPVRAPAKPAPPAPVRAAAATVDETALLRAVNDQAPDVVPAGTGTAAQSARPAPAPKRQGQAAPAQGQPMTEKKVAPAAVEAAPVAAIVPPPTRSSQTAAHPAAQALMPLISASAQKSVGNSFDALSETLKQKAGRDLAEMTEDMLRPMLSDWLDNNLPSIVERLVRTEIERIARGDPRQG